MKRTITVLQDDIDNGQKQISSNCAIARAVKRDWNAGRVNVFSTFIGIVSDAGVRDITLPPEATAFIERFDRGAPVEPFKFEVEAGDL